ncbi:MAG TPA: SRPBCC domain-containing protein [Ktedonobacteraceae bacterium]|nr:SRPBCC domain-containing protein [Ktedonobacteraceae bacterium]
MEAVVIERSIVIKADRERVWQAITTPEHIAKWFEQVHFERLAVGEVLTFGREGDGSIALVEPMERFGFRWQIAWPHPAQTLVIFALETVPGGTRVIVTEQGFEALPEEVRTEHFKRNTQGWAAVLDNLVAYMTSRQL